MSRTTSLVALIFLLLVCASQSVQAQDYQGSAGYAARPLTLPEGWLRIDIAPPDYGYMDHGELNGGRGMRVFIPKEGDARASLGLGGAYGIIDELEAGALLFPFLIEPGFDFGDMELYCRYAFLREKARLGVQPTLRIPTYSRGFALGFGLPAMFQLGGSLRLDTGVEFEMIFGRDDHINLDLPLAFNFNIGRSGFIGPRTGLFFPSFDGVAINLGVQGGAIIDSTVDLTASVNFPGFIWIDGGDSFNPDVEIIFGANIYVDVL